MKMKNVQWLKVVMIIFSMALFAACDDSNEPDGKGDVEFEITDAPIDDAQVKSVVVTVADVKVDGKSIEGFSKQSIDLKAYSEGKTKLLGTSKLDARTYNSLTLVLDLDNDADGNAPGCYVLDKDNIKYKLRSSASGKLDVAVNKSWKVTKNTTNRLVMDVDLRKAVRYSDDPAVRYAFVSDNNLQAAVRVVMKERSGTIEGSYQEDSNSNADKIIVYAYKKGTFSAATETQPQGTDQLLFKNAVASAEVKSGLTGKVFTLAFLEEGEYELHFAAYTRNPGTGKHNFEARLQSETRVDGSVGEFITIKGGATVSIATRIKGII